MCLNEYTDAVHMDKINFYIAFAKTNVRIERGYNGCVMTIAHKWNIRTNVKYLFAIRNGWQFLALFYHFAQVAMSPKMCWN